MPCTEDCICPLCAPKQMFYANVVICSTKASSCLTTGSLVSRGGGAFQGLNTTFLNSITNNITNSNIQSLCCSCGNISDLSVANSNITNLTVSSLFINGVELKSNVIDIINNLYG